MLKQWIPGSLSLHTLWICGMCADISLHAWFCMLIGSLRLAAVDLVVPLHSTIGMEGRKTWLQACRTCSGSNSSSTFFFIAHAIQFCISPLCPWCSEVYGDAPKPFSQAGGYHTYSPHGHGSIIDILPFELLKHSSNLCSCFSSCFVS